MSLRFVDEERFDWKVTKIAVVGPGIVGMPMAAMLADARVLEGTERPARVQVVQRDSPTSGWKVRAINEGRSVIGGVEPGLDEIVKATVTQGILSATHDYRDVADADVVLVCIQTDKKGSGPDYGPLFEGLENLARALSERPRGNVPLVVFESTLAPSSMATVIRDLFARYGLQEGRDVLLGNSPNRVMPGRLVDRVASSDKIVAGLHPLTPILIQRLYRRIVTGGTLYPTNSMTAEVVKTLENAYRDVRIAFAAEMVRNCDDHDIDFFAVRDEVNLRIAQSDGASDDPGAVPIGGILVPTVGVGGHCLPKDGILLWWRKLESSADTRRSLILESRSINDESPSETIRLAERHLGSVFGRTVALLGTAYRFDSEDTRNSPTLVLAELLLDRNCRVRLHDPYVNPEDQNLRRFGLHKYFTSDLEEALQDTEIVFFCTGHGVYAEGLDEILRLGSRLSGIVDGCNLYSRHRLEDQNVRYVGIGRGEQDPPTEFVDFVEASFRVVERGLANELQDLITFLNEQYADGVFNQVNMDVVRRLAGTCITGCAIAEPGEVEVAPQLKGFVSRLVARAVGSP